MLKITYKRNETETTKEFTNRNDLIEFVILNNIKDEELVSINLGCEEITGGINGLALYTLRKINEERENEAEDEEVVEPAEEDEYECDCYYNDCCNPCECGSDLPQCAEEEDDFPEHFSGIFDRPVFVNNIYNTIRGIEINDDRFEFDPDEKVKIIKQGYKYKKANELEGKEIIKVKASRLRKGDIFVLPNNNKYGW